VNTIRGATIASMVVDEGLPYAAAAKVAEAARRAGRGVRVMAEALDDSPRGAECERVQFMTPEQSESAQASTEDAAEAKRARKAAKRARDAGAAWLGRGVSESWVQMRDNVRVSQNARAAMEARS
jgi:hypothetical protein